MKTDILREFSTWLQTPYTRTTTSLSDIMLQGKRDIVRVFHDAARRIPAYKHFLKKEGFNLSLNNAISELSDIPIMTKENYISQYSLQDRSWDGNITNQHIISSSSGTTGKQIYWPRMISDDLEGAKLHEKILIEQCQIDSKKTLFINGFALGNWIAGTYTFTSILFLHYKGYPITQMSPGYVKDAVLEIMEAVSPEYEQTILAGHIPFLKDCIDTAHLRGMDLKPLSLYLLGAGQAITETWRRTMNQKLTDSKENRCINLYGSADAALMGWESNESISIRKKQQHHYEDGRIPAYYSYDPSSTWFEELHGELLVSKQSASPLIRYAMKDEGGILTESSRKTRVSLPIVYLFGRRKFMIKLYGANIYAEHIQHSFDSGTFENEVTGRFLIELQEKNDDVQFICRVELRIDVVASEQHATAIKQHIVETLLQHNKEYAYIHSQYHEKVHPRIVFHHYADPTYFPGDKIKKTA